MNLCRFSREVLAQGHASLRTEPNTSNRYLRSELKQTYNHCPQRLIVQTSEKLVVPTSQVERCLLAFCSRQINDATSSPLEASIGKVYRRSRHNHLQDRSLPITLGNPLRLCRAPVAIGTFIANWELSRAQISARIQTTRSDQATNIAYYAALQDFSLQSQSLVRTTVFCLSLTIKSIEHASSHGVSTPEPMYAHKFQGQPNIVPNDVLACASKQRQFFDGFALFRYQPRTRLTPTR